MPVTYNPVAASVAGDAADHLAATDDGRHILGASTTQLFDIEHSPTTDTSQVIAPTGPCPGVVTGTAGALAINTTLRQLALTDITPTQIDQVITSPDSTKAFVTYTAATATGLLPLYTPSTTAGGTGTLTNVQLGTGAVDPIAGVFSPDSTQFFVSTSGDNLIHIVNTTTLKDTQQLNPQLLNAGGQVVPAQFIVVKPRATS
jgi:WD40 repeat protein